MKKKTCQKKPALKKYVLKRKFRYCDHVKVRDENSVTVTGSWPRKKFQAGDMPNYLKSFQYFLTHINL